MKVFAYLIVCKCERYCSYAFSYDVLDMHLYI